MGICNQLDMGVGCVWTWGIYRPNGHFHREKDDTAACFSDKPTWMGMFTVVHLAHQLHIWCTYSFIQILSLNWPSAGSVSHSCQLWWRVPGCTLAARGSMALLWSLKVAWAGGVRWVSVKNLHGCCQRILPLIVPWWISIIPITIDESQLSIGHNIVSIILNHQ